MRLVAIAVLGALAPRADRQYPVAAHLEVVVERLHLAIIEGVARFLVLGAPDQCLMGVGKAGAAEIGHRVGLAPHDVVQDPEIGVLQQGADAIDVVIAADHPDRAIVLQDTPRLGEPFAGEIVVGGETVELVPIVVAGIDLAALGPQQVAAELEVVGRVGEDHVDAFVGQARHFGDAVAKDDLVERKLLAGLGTSARARTPVRLRYRQDHVHVAGIPLFDKQGESGASRGQAKRG